MPIASSTPATILREFAEDRLKPPTAIFPSRSIAPSRSSAVPAPFHFLKELGLVVRLVAEMAL